MSMFHRAVPALVLLLLALGGCASASQDGTATPPAAAPGLAGTSWQLVRFAGGDDTVLTPDDPAKYALAFNADNSVAVRIDCNRGRGTWRSSQPPHVEFGPIALTKMLCPAAPLTERFGRDLAYVRSYVIEGGHLHLSLMADGGIYEFAPAD